MSNLTETQQQALNEEIKTLEFCRNEIIKKISPDLHLIEKDPLELKLSLITTELQYKLCVLGFNCLHGGVYSYKNNPVAFIEREVIIKNVDYDPSTTPFHLFGFQRNFINNDLYPAYLSQESLLDEKTRQMGLSWLYCAFALWGLLFDNSFTGFMLSYKERLVDDGGENSTADSLFGKIKFMYDNLSDKFKYLYSKAHKIRSKQILQFKKLNITNRKTKAYLVGSSANINAGRGGTYKFALWDETALTEKSEVIFQAFKMASKCKCYNSTVRGRGGVFARLRWDETKPVKVVTLHWLEHPHRVENLRRDESGKLISDWYVNECKGLTESQIGQELDIDYETSVVGRIYDKLDRNIHFQKFDWVEEWRDRTIISWDLGISDEMFGTVLQADGQGGFIAVDEVCGEDYDGRFYIDLLCGVAPAEFKFMSAPMKKMYEEFLQRSRERNYRVLLNIVGPDGVQRSVTSKYSLLKQFTSAGKLAYDDTDGGRIINRRYVNLRMQALTGFKVLDRITEVKKLINPMHNKIIISQNCPKLWERLINYKWSQDGEGRNREIPLHDFFSNGADSFGYGILYFTKGRKIGTLPGNQNSSTISNAAIHRM